MKGKHRTDTERALFLYTAIKFASNRPLDVTSETGESDGRTPKSRASGHKVENARWHTELIGKCSVLMNYRVTAASSDSHIQPRVPKHIGIFLQGAKKATVEACA